jgi:hypothetical protein
MCAALQQGVLGEVDEDEIWGGVVEDRFFHECPAVAAHTIASQPKHMVLCNLKWYAHLQQ